MGPSAIAEAWTVHWTVRPMSVEEWTALPEDEPGELVDGLLREEEAADSPHELIVSALLYILLTWARPRGGRVLASETNQAVSSAPLRTSRDGDCERGARDRDVPAPSASGPSFSLLRGCLSSHGSPFQARRD